MGGKPYQFTVSEIQQRVEKLLEEQRRTAKWLYEGIGMSKVGYKEMWARESVKVTVLQQIADLLSVPLTALLYGEEKASTAQQVAEAQAPYGKSGRFIEQRIEELEMKVRKLTEQMRIK